MAFNILIAAALAASVEAYDIPVIQKLPVGAPEISASTAAQLTKGKVGLGRSLFFDKRLSASQSISCSSCHDPSRGFSNGLPVALGEGAQAGDRNVPVLFNKAWSTIQQWDGEVATLEKQTLRPIVNKHEMANSISKALKTINADKSYRRAFQENFARPADKQALAEALSSFLRSLVTGNSRYDRFVAGDTSALNQTEQRGKSLFFDKFKCSTCHSGYNFTNENIRPSCTPSNMFDSAENYHPKYKVPSLRNLALSSPYFHDGRLSTLDEVLEFYDGSGPLPKAAADRVDFPEITIPSEEKAALRAFLLSLGGETYSFIPPPSSRAK